MSAQDRIGMEIFKVVTRAIAESDNLDIMADQLTQLLAGALDIKASTIFVLDPETKELEVLASYGLSLEYLNKGPLWADKSIGCLITGQPVVVRDVTATDRLQYPEDAKREGIASIISLPIRFLGEDVGTLRLYHHQVWDISPPDLDSLLLLAEIIGLALMYTKLNIALYTIKDVIKDLHLGLEPFFKAD